MIIIIISSSSSFNSCFGIRSVIPFGVEKPLELVSRSRKHSCETNDIFFWNECRLKSCLAASTVTLLYKKYIYWMPLMEQYCAVK